MVTLLRSTTSHLSKVSTWLVKDVIQTLFGGLTDIFQMLLSMTIGGKLKLAGPLVQTF